MVAKIFSCRYSCSWSHTVPCYSSIFQASASYKMCIYLALHSWTQLHEHRAVSKTLAYASQIPMSLANGAKYLSSLYLFPCLLNHELSTHYYELMVKTGFCNHVGSPCLFYYGFTLYVLIRWIWLEVLESWGAFNSERQDVIIMLRVTSRLPPASGNN